MTRRPYRIAPLPPEEAEVCRRFRQVREGLGISQQQLARCLGVSLGIVANAEYCKAPVRCDVGLKLCALFVIDEKWLATGRGDKQPCVGLLCDPIFLTLDYAQPFREAFLMRLKPIYDDFAVSTNRHMDTITRLLSGSNRLGREAPMLMLKLIVNDALAESGRLANACGMPTEALDSGLFRGIVKATEKWRDEMRMALAARMVACMRDKRVHPRPEATA